jgi:glycosyl transferase, family 25
MHSFIIHMRDDRPRQANAEKLLGALPGAEIVDAIVGRAALATGDARIRPGNIHVPHYPFALGPGEVGCLLSHRACWRNIVDRGLEYALIAEDDLAFDPMFWPDVLALISTHARPERYIRIPAKDREVPAQVLAAAGSARLFLPRVVGLQTVCQVVGASAAERLLAATSVLDRPVDTLLQMHWVTGQPIHTIVPSGVRELTDELGGSTIQKKNPTGGVLMREVRRAIYRARVRARPQRPESTA